jgi:thymidine kinase
MKERGRLTVIVGTMFAGKTDELIRRIKRWRRHFEKSVLVFKPTTDTRSRKGYIQTAEMRKMRAHEIPVEHPEKILKIVMKKHWADEIVIDEIQFFLPDSKLVRVADEICWRGYNVTVGGLDLDFRGEPFATTALLMALADQVIKLDPPSCGQCRKPARYPQRLIGGKPAPYESPLIKVGGKESYEPRCADCYELPGKPAI